MSSSSASTISYNHSLPSIRKYEEVNHRLEEINTKLAEVRKRRLQFAKEKGGSPHRQKVQHPKRTSKMHHPHLDFVLAEVAFSPYLTKPDEPYSRLVINIPDKLRALKHKNIKLDELPKDEKLLDMKKVKDIFINEVFRYNSSFTNTDSVSSRSRKHSSATSICSSSLPSLQPRRAPSAQLLKKSWGDSPFERQEPGTDATENICSPVMANNGEGNVLPNFLTQQSEAASAEEDHYELLFDAAGIEESTKGAHAIADGLDNDKHQNVSEVLTEGKESSETDDGSKGENVSPNSFEQPSKAASAEEDHYELLFDAAGIEESSKGAHAIADGLDNDKHQNVSEVLTEGKESSETDDGSKGENVSPNSFEQPSKAALAEEDHYDIIFDAVETNQTEANTKGAHAIADGLDNDKHQNVSEVLTEGKESSETDDGSKGENVSPNSFEQPSKAALAEEDHYDIIFDAVETNQTEANTKGAHAIADGLDNDKHQNVSEVLTEGKESSETDDGSKGENVSPNSFEQPSKAALAEEDHYDIIFDAVETNQTEASTEGAHAIADGLDNDRDQNSACITYCDNIEAGLTSDEIYSLFHSYSRLMFLSSAPS